MSCEEATNNGKSTDTEIMPRAIGEVNYMKLVDRMEGAHQLSKDQWIDVRTHQTLKPVVNGVGNDEGARLRALFHRVASRIS